MQKMPRVKPETKVRKKANDDALDVPFPCKKERGSCFYRLCLVKLGNNNLFIRRKMQFIMDLERCLVEKRSCKSYLDKSVPIELIGEMLKAGTFAPSAGNLQNWQFIVVRTEEKRFAIAAACHKQDWMRGAPVHIIICNDVKKVTDMFSRKGKLYATQACAIAGQNIMLKATDVGLYTCWVGSFDEYALAKILKLPDNIVPEMIITIGYSDQLEQGMDRVPVERVTFFDEHGKNVVEKSFFPLSKYGENVAKVLEKATGINQQQESSEQHKPLEKLRNWFRK